MCCDLCPRTSVSNRVNRSPPPPCRRRPVRAQLRSRNARQQLLSPGLGRRGRKEEEENQGEEEREKEQREEENGRCCGGSGEEDQKERIWPLKVGDLIVLLILTD